MSIELVEYTSDRLSDLIKFLSDWESVHPEIASVSRVEWQKCFFYLALKNERIVGCIGQIPHEFFYGINSGRYGDIEHIGWAVCLVLDTDDNATRKEAGRLLLSKCENKPPLKYTGVGMVPGVEGVYIRRGHVVRRDCSSMYGRFSHPAKVMRYLQKPAWLSPVIKTVNFIIRKRRVMKGYFKVITKFESKWDPIWQKLLDESYELYGERTANFLNYKLSQPGKEYHSLLFYTDQQSNLPDGYLIYRLAQHNTKDLRFVKICDYVGTPAAKTRLISEAMACADKIDNYGIVAIGSVDDKNIFRSMGLYISKPYPICMSPTITSKMHITFFDSDLDELW